MRSKLHICLMIISAIILAFFYGLPSLYAQSSQNKKPSPADCDAYARNYAERYSRGFLGGAARGAAGGALFGAVIDGSKGAKKGAVLGGAVNGTAHAVNRDQIRKQAYNDCMAGRVKW